MPVPIDDMIACIEREIGMRERTYPRWVREKKLTIAACDQEMERIRAVLATLKRLRADEAFVPVHRGPTESDIRADERAKVKAVVLNHVASSIMVKIDKELGVLS